MRWIEERIAAFVWAKGHREWLYTASAMFIAAAGSQLWPQISEQLSDWVVVPPSDKGAGMTFLGHPVWSIFVIFGLVCLCVWLFESLVRVHGELSPKLEASFDPNSGGVSVTTQKNSKTGEIVDTVKYVRVAVNCTTQKSVQDCVANIVKIERRLDMSRTEALWDQDALPLQWAITGGYAANIHYLTKRYLDVMFIPKKTGLAELLTISPNRLVPEFAKNGIFLLTVVVSGGGISNKVVFEIEKDGTFDGFKARPI